MENGVRQKLTELEQRSYVAIEESILDQLMLEQGNDVFFTNELISTSPEDITSLERHEMLIRRIGKASLRKFYISVYRNDANAEHMIGGDSWAYTIETSNQGASAIRCTTDQLLEDGTYQPKRSMSHHDHARLINQLMLVQRHVDLASATPQN